MDKNDGAASLVRSDALLTAAFTPLRCDGSCDEHRGDVRPVECWAPGDSEPWRFNYCDEAIAEDTRRGFRVVEANKPLSGTEAASGSVYARKDGST